MPATTPPLTCGTTTPRITSQRVAPSPTAASLSSRGTLAKSSRQIAVVIGVAMIASTRIAGKTPENSGVPKSGMKPNALCSQGLRSLKQKGRSTKIPHRPITTEGTAANMSISEPIGPRIVGGAISERKSAIAIESGAAISSPPNDVTRVPTTNQRAPYTFVTGFQVECQTKAIPLWSTAGHATLATSKMIRAITPTASSAARPASPSRVRSPSRSPTRRVRRRPTGVVFTASTVRNHFTN